MRPDAVFGHGAGELAAAGAAGVFDLEAGLRFAARRGALASSLPPGGAPAAVFAPAEQVADALSGSVSLAADNGEHSVVSGPEKDVLGLLRDFEASGFRVERLGGVPAFHGPPVDPVLDALEAAAPEGAAAAIPFVSGVSGRLLEGAPEGAYWRRQAREPVRFGTALGTLAEAGVGVVVELGPQGVLGPMAAAWPGPEAPVVVSTLRRNGSGDFAAAAGAAYGAGLEIAFTGLFAGERRRRVALPTYPFQRRRYWVRGADGAGLEAAHPLLGTRHEMENGEVAFERELSVTDLEWLRDHRVFGEVVIGGMHYASLAFVAQAADGTGAGASVEDVRIERPLLVPAEAPGGDAPVRRLRFLLRRADEDGSRRWEGLSRSSEDEAWVRRSAGRVRPVAAGAGAPERPDFEALRRDLAPVGVDAFYDWLWDLGMQFGPSVPGVEGALVRPGRSVRRRGAAGGRWRRRPGSGCIRRRSRPASRRRSRFSMRTGKWTTAKGPGSRSAGTGCGSRDRCRRGRCAMRGSWRAPGGLPVRPRERGRWTR